jgi:cell shape-determining protein MreC
MFKGERIINLLVAIILFSSIVVLADLIGYLAFVKRFRSFITYPISYTASKVQLSLNTFGALFSQGSLTKENAQLKQRVIELESALSLQNEDKALAAALDSYKKTIPSATYKKTFNALILDTRYQYSPGKLLLAAGNNNGLKEGMPVVLGATYIGYLSEVSDFSSVVTTYQHAGQQFVGYLLSRKITASIKTTLTEIYLFDLLATDIIQLHDQVSIKRAGYPYFFQFGTISTLPNVAGSADRLVTIRNPITTTELTYVTIVLE